MCIYIYIYIYIQTAHFRIINLFPNPNVTGLFFFLMKLLLCNVCYIELFTRKIYMFTFE